MGTGRRDDEEDQLSFPVPVVMLTGLGNSEVEDKALEGGVVIYLEKNQVTPLLITAAVQRTIKHHQKRLNMVT